MEDQLITFDTAKLAKEKGATVILPMEGFPTQSLLQKWLREVHNLEVEVSKMWHYSLTDDKEMNALTFYRVTVCDYIKPREDYILYMDKGKEAFHVYEEALEEGLKEALKLIK